MSNQQQLYEDFFQKSNSYYLEQLKYYDEGKKFRFNYAALIFGLFWFLYRKMYLEFFIIFAFYYVETLFENTVLVKTIGIEQTKLVNIIVTVIPLIVLGIIGNNLYIKKAKRTVKIATEKYSEYEEQKKLLNKKGGTSFLYITILLVLIILATALS